MEIMAKNLQYWKVLGIVPQNSKTHFDAEQVVQKAKIIERYITVIDFPFEPKLDTLGLIEGCLEGAFTNFEGEVCLSVNNLQPYHDVMDNICYPVEIRLEITNTK